MDEIPLSTLVAALFVLLIASAFFSISEFTRIRPLCSICRSVVFDESGKSSTRASSRGCGVEIVFRTTSYANETDSFDPSSR